MIGARSWAGLLVTIGTLAAAPASGQSSVGGRLEISAGGSWVGSVAFPEVPATEAAPVRGSKTVFLSSTQLEASPGFALRVGAHLTRRLSAESTLALNSTRLATHISGDVEGAAETTASESVVQYLVEGGVAVHLGRWRGGRLEPFAALGGGYLRQLHQGQTLIETGRSYYLGGGTHYLLKRGGAGRVKSLGVRLDARAAWLDGGVAIDLATHVAPVVGAALFVRF